jgi:hypothetical protein
MDRSHRGLSGHRHLQRELTTLRAMVAIYCRDRHGRADSLCEECSRLAAYAEKRLDKCPFGEDKPVCNRCTVHCYSPKMRDRVKAVMRYAGPRMLWRHPVLAIAHLIDQRRPAPPPPGRPPAAGDGDA